MGVAKPGEWTMKGTTDKSTAVVSRLRVKSVLWLILMVAAMGWCAEVALAQPPLRQRRQGLTPAEEKGNNPKRDAPRRGGPGPAGLTPEEQEYVRLVPQGVAFPRILIRVFRELELTPEQRTHLENLAKRAGNQVPALNRLRKAQSELLDEALYGESFDPAVIDKRASDLAGTQAEIIKIQARLMTQIRQILNPEQSSKFRTLLMRERDGLQ